MAPWARVDLDRPFVVLAVDNDAKMRALLPAYAKRPTESQPVSVWVSGDRHYLAIRSDVQAEDRSELNPHVHAYFSYTSLILRQSLDARMPVWFMRGLAGLLSNTIVRDSFILVGPPCRGTCASSASTGGCDCRRSSRLHPDRANSRARDCPASTPTRGRSCISWCTGSKVRSRRASTSSSGS
jgi:hypothetical protein